MGKRIGADTLISGGFQKSGDKLVLTARVFDPETGDVAGETARVDGPFQDLFKLQASLARQLAAAIQGSIPGVPAATATGRSPEAFEAFSDGLYFLRNDLAPDALSQFDLTLSLDPGYPGAHHYRGVTLAKLNRLDEAIDAFKRALPRSEPERLVSRNWEGSVCFNFFAARDRSRAGQRPDPSAARRFRRPAIRASAKTNCLW